MSLFSKNTKGFHRQGAPRSVSQIVGCGTETEKSAREGSDVNAGFGP